MEKMELMMARMLGEMKVEIRTNEAKADVNIKELKEDIKTNQAKADANLREMKEEMRAGQEPLKEEMLAKMETHHERMARMDSQLEKMDACIGTTEATDLEVNPKEIEIEAEHEEIPKEEAAMETIGALAL
jgi:hypothetical protein